MGRCGNDLTSMTVMAATMVLSLLTLTEFVAANGYHQLAWRKFDINNIFPFDGIQPCPPANPNTVAFYPSSSNSLNGTVNVVGDFNAASIGECSGNTQYGVPPGTIIHYYIYGDWIIFRIAGRVPTALKVVYQAGQIYTVAVGNEFYVSVLTDAGSAR
ncbi:unnamed protein product [Calypogeia fissa]